MGFIFPLLVVLSLVGGFLYGKLASVNKTPQPTPQIIIQTPTPSPFPTKQQVKTGVNRTSTVNVAVNTPTPQQKSQQPQEIFVMPTVYNYPTLIPYISPTPLPTNTPQPSVEWYLCSLTNESWCSLHMNDSTIPPTEYTSKCSNRDDAFYCVHGGKHLIAGVVPGLENFDPNACVCVK